MVGGPLQRFVRRHCHKVTFLLPWISTEVKGSCQIVASSTKNLDAKVLLSFSHPFSIRGAGSILALSTPCIGPWILRAFLAPPKSHTYSLLQASRDVLAYEGLFLSAMHCALNVGVLVFVHEVTLSDA
jgi:hypothetical protein